MTDHAINEWWLKDNNLHIGDTIKLEEEGITIPSYRHSYKNIPDLTLVNHGEYCVVYSTSFPMLDIWKYVIGHGAVPGTIYSKSLKLPLLDIYHAGKIGSRPHIPITIECTSDFITIYWSNQGHKSIFEISSETFLEDELPAQRASDYYIEKGLMIQSPCKTYYAKYAKKYENVYIFNDHDEFLFRLDHNTYKSHYCCNIIEFVNDKIIINDHHSSIGIYDMTGKLCHKFCGCDEFYTQKFRVKEDDGKEYLVLYGFIWSPVYFMSIYEIEKMISDGSYEPDQYWERDTADLGDAEVDVAVLGNKVCYGMSPSAFKAYMIDKKNKVMMAKRELLKKRWSEDNMLKVILNGCQGVDKTIKQKILSSTECPKITCFGGNSGSEFVDHANNLILKPVSNSIVDFIARILISCYDNVYSKKNGIYLKEVNLIFTVEGMLNIHIIIPMIKIADKDSYLFPENDESVTINFS